MALKRIDIIKLLTQTVFPEPEALLTGSSRLLGLDGRKMSKSYNNFIAISEKPEDIRVKVQGMFTDPLRIRLSDPGHPENCNVHSYYAVFASEKEKEVSQLCLQSQIGCTDCKRELAKIIVKFLAPIQEKRDKLFRNKKQVLGILKQGEKKARVLARKTALEDSGLLGLAYEL